MVTASGSFQELQIKREEYLPFRLSRTTISRKGNNPGGLPMATRLEMISWV